MSSIIVPYFKPEDRSAVLKMLGLPSDAFAKKLVHVTSATDVESGDRIVTIHYNPDKLEQLCQNPGTYKEKDISNLCNTRGVIIDLKTKSIKLRSFPRTVSIVTNSVPTDYFLPINIGGVMITPINGTYKKCYGGSLLRFYSHNGVVRGSTHRKHDASSSFFGDSDKFIEIWLKDQDVFPSLASLYENCTDDVVHLFIINNRKLLVDSREKQERDQVVYLESYSMTDPTKQCDLTDFITSRNRTASKTIEICLPLSTEEVNRRLSGTAINGPIPGNGSLRSAHFLPLFSGGEKIIYRNEYGIFTLVPPSCVFRQRIMEGKVNVSKLFVDSVADLSNNSRGYVDIAYSLENLRTIADKLVSGEEINLSDYQTISDSPQLMILTNLIFVVPINRIDDCFRAYSEFDGLVAESIDYFIEKRAELVDAILNGSLDTIEGMSSGTKLKTYLTNRLPKLKEYIEGPKTNWSESAVERFKEYYTTMEQTEDEDVKAAMLRNMGIVSIISNATDDVLYSIISYKKKASKERAALAKRFSSINDIVV